MKGVGTSDEGSEKVPFPSRCLWLNEPGFSVFPLSFALLSLLLLGMSDKQLRSEIEISLCTHSRLTLYRAAFGRVEPIPSLPAEQNSLQ